MNRYVFEELDKKRSFYNSLSKQEFEEKVIIDDDFAEGFITYARRLGVEVYLTNYQQQLKKYLRATMAQQLFGNEVFEIIINQDDPMIEKVKALSKE